MCNARNCLEWPTIFIFFPFKGDLFEPARSKVLPEIRDTSKGAIMPSTPDIFFPKTKDIFMDYTVFHTITHPK